VFRGDVTVEISINGEPKTIDPDTTLAGLIDQLGMQPRYLAVERNLELVPRNEHAGCVLQQNDRLEIVTLVGGG
jgi:thiamine biosynthesis protein ThiS